MGNKSIKVEKYEIKKSVFVSYLPLFITEKISYMIKKVSQKKNSTYYSEY